MTILLILLGFLGSALTLNNAEYPVVEVEPSILHTCKHEAFKCPNNRQKLHLLVNRVNRKVAPCACANHGLKLADITIDNFSAANQIIYDCIGDYQHIWIHSYGGDAFDGIGLALYSEKGAVGAVAIPLHSDQEAQVLCEEAV